MDRVLRDAATKRRIAIADSDAEAHTATAVAVAVTDSAGVAIAGSPFAAAVNDGLGPNVWEYTLPAASAAVLDVYDEVWTFTGGTAAGERRRTQFEIVAGFYFEIPDLLRLFTDEHGADEHLADPSNPSPSVLRQARDAAEDKFESHCRPAFRRRGRRVSVDGSGSSGLVIPDLYPRRLISASIDGTALDAGEIDDVALYDPGVLVRGAGSWASGNNNVTIHYEHGKDSVEGPIRDALLRLARSYIVKSPLPERATAESTAEGTFRISIAGRDGPTGIPDVDAILEEFAGEPFVGA